MSFTHVQGTTNTGQSGDNPTATFSVAVTSGNVVTGAVGWVGAASGTATLTRVDDDKGNSYTVDGTAFNSPQTYYWCSFHSAAAVTNAPTVITATISDAGSSPQFGIVMIDEWSGFSGSLRDLGSNSAVGTSAGTLSVSIGSAVGSALIGYCVDVGSGGVTVGAGFTQEQYVISTWLSELATGSGVTDVVAATTASVSGGALWGMALSGTVTPPPTGVAGTCIVGFWE